MGVFRDNLGKYLCLFSNEVKLDEEGIYGAQDLITHFKRRRKGEMKMHKKSVVHRVIG